ncbi:MAG: branched-chain amino acid ABC transporter substrate-binding protein [Desulfobacula sp.]|jgi:branched-chain amino acid transport system substrate-binding protein|nr:branched-chain amino acid ABC transporter substrate-binding protein [Desulfobacula sp.]
MRKILAISIFFGILTLSVCPAGAEIPIGMVGPFTGIMEWYGEQMEMGVQEALNDLNARGGVLGESVKLIKVDDACDTEQAVAAAKRIVDSKATMVVGHLCSNTSIVAAPIYTANNILMISPASTATKLTEEGRKNVFRVIGRDDQQGGVAAKYLAEHWKDKNIGILHDNLVYGKNLAIEVKKHRNERGVMEKYYGFYDPLQHDYSKIIKSLQDARVDVVFVGGYIEGISSLLEQAHNQNLKFQLISGDSLASESFWLISGDLAQGARFTFTPDPRTNPAAISVVKKIRDRGFEPEGFTLHSYATVQVWAQAVEKAGSLELDKVTDAMYQTVFDTVLGKFSFDSKGDVTGIPSWAWYEWNNKQYKLVP